MRALSCQPLMGRRLGPEQRQRVSLLHISRKPRTVTGRYHLCSQRAGNLLHRGQGENEKNSMPWDTCPQKLTASIESVVLLRLSSIPVRDNPAQLPSLFFQTHSYIIHCSNKEGSRGCGPQVPLDSMVSSTYFTPFT